MRAIGGRSGWPGRGLVLLLSAASSGLSLPRYHSRPPPARLISGPHNPTSPCLPAKSRPAPNASQPATDAPSCNLTYPPLPCSPISGPPAYHRPPYLLLPKSGLSLSREQPELLEIPVGHRSVSATSITNVS